jgi:hypothetical protein
MHTLTCQLSALARPAKAACQCRRTAGAVVLNNSENLTCMVSVFSMPSSCIMISNNAVVLATFIFIALFACHAHSVMVQSHPMQVERCMHIFQMYST